MIASPGALLARALTGTGQIIDPLWHRALLSVDRAAFIPDTVWVSSREHPGYFEPVTSEDPEYKDWAHQDYALAVQVDDGTPTGGPNGESGWGKLRTSSISQPSLVVAMLQALDVRGGHRVLEVGTGTGYNTALLCHALGQDAVVSVEIDETVAATAVKNLAATGYQPTLLVEDAVGLPESGVGRGRFDRLLATVAARGEVPISWVRQVRPGGVIVTPWEVGNQPGVLLRLEVQEDGQTAHGRVIDDAAFMLLRSQRPPGTRLSDVRDEAAPAVVRGYTEVNPRLVAYRNPGWQIVLGYLAPDLRYAVHEAAEDRPEWAGEATVTVHTPDGSWAEGEYTPAGGSFEVKRDGERDLWAEIGAAWEAWCGAGRPSRDRLGVTVDAGGTHLWSDQPDRVFGSESVS